MLCAENSPNWSCPKCIAEGPPTARPEAANFYSASANAYLPNSSNNQFAGMGSYGTPNGAFDYQHGYRQQTAAGSNGYIGSNGDMSTQSFYMDLDDADGEGESDLSMLPYHMPNAPGAYGQPSNYYANHAGQYGQQQPPAQSGTRVKLPNDKKGPRHPTVLRLKLSGNSRGSSAPRGTTSSGRKLKRVTPYDERPERPFRGIDGAEDEDGVRSPSTARRNKGKGRRIEESDDETDAAQRAIDSRPYGGILTGPDAETGDRVPMSEDKKRFQDAKRRADVCPASRSLLMARLMYCPAV